MGEKGNTTTPETNGSSSPEDSLVMFKVELYCFLAIIPLGIFLNFLCFTIFLKSKVCKTATGLHMTYLAIADNVVLISMLLADSGGTQRLFLPGLYNHGFINCEGTFFTVMAGFLWSGILLTSATFERFLSVAYPLKIKLWNLYQKSKILMVIYIVISFGLYSFSLLCLESVLSEDGDYQCVPVVKYVNICHYGDIIISTVLSNCLCSVLIFIFTVLTSICLYKMVKKRAQLSQDLNSGKEFQISLMLVTVATLFLVLRLPEIIAFQLVSFFAGNNFQSSVSETLIYIYPLLAVLVALNHAINFFVYVIYLKNFRKTFIQLFPTWLQNKLGLKIDGQTKNQENSIGTEATDASCGDKPHNQLGYIREK